MTKLKFTHKAQNNQRRRSVFACAVLLCGLSLLAVWTWMFLSVVNDEGKHTTKPLAAPQVAIQVPTAESAVAVESGESVVNADEESSAVAGDDDKPLDKPVQIWVELYHESGCQGAQVLKATTENSHAQCDQCFDTCMQEFPDGSPAHQRTKSLRVKADGMWPTGVSVSAYSVCAGEFYYTDPGLLTKGLTPESGCVDLDSLVFVRFDGIPADIIRPLQSFHIVYSCESSTYFGYQTYANLYGFRQSANPPGTGYTRLLTASEPDDLVGIVKTFTVK
jgi:hypothetical protein